MTGRIHGDAHYCVRAGSSLRNVDFVLPKNSMIKSQNPAAVWARNNYQRKAELLKERSRENRRVAKQAVYDKLGNKCSNPDCRWLNEDGSTGCMDVRCLQIDHVNDDAVPSGDGALKSSCLFYVRVINDTEGRYQLLCSNCNWIKRCNRDRHSNGVHRTEVLASTD